MDVNTRNKLFLQGKIDREDLWPKVVEYENQARIFKFNFGLDSLPEEPGVIIIRGPRQYGKSTWLEQALRNTLTDFGKGTGFFINGDELSDLDELELKILEIKALFSSKAKVKRIFIDEITAVVNWEKAVKRLSDRGELRDVLLVTTGSKASDLRRGSEKLPGRKGKLSRTEYIFTGISYKDFFVQCGEELGKDAVLSYLISGGSPIAAKEIWQFGRIPDYFFEIVRDWVIGEVVKSGRSRQFLIPLMRAIMDKAPSRLGYLNIAKTAGLANNTVAAEYVEQLSDLLAILPSFQYDLEKRVPLQRKPCKFHFINIAVALAFRGGSIASVHDFSFLPNTERAKWYEWLVCQELFRRQCIRGGMNREALYYWSSKDHEIDFVDAEENLIEVKLGKSSPLEYSWFAKQFPKKKLLVINDDEFMTSNVKGVTLHQFLLADGFPHPYPGMVEDVELYNDLVKF